MTSHSNTLLSINPQLIPGMSLSFCICLNCFPRIKAAADGEEVFAGEPTDRLRGDMADMIAVNVLVVLSRCRVDLTNVIVPLLALLPRWAR